MTVAEEEVVKIVETTKAVRYAKDGEDGKYLEINLIQNPYI